MRWNTFVCVSALAALAACSQPVAPSDSGSDTSMDAAARLDARAAESDAFAGTDSPRELDAAAGDDAASSDAATDACVSQMLCLDRDRDDHGDPTASLSGCPGSIAGYVAACDDCDDTAAAIHAGQREQPCNSIDDDCDSGTSDVAAMEVCDGMPNDCDMAVDEGFACALGTEAACATSCDPAGMMTGRRSCIAGCAWSDCAVPSETCNGRDDDCNGISDDGGGFACIRGSTVSCTTSCGSTGSGACTSTCTTPTAAMCTAPAETCNGSDDDCDSMIDEPGCARGRTSIGCTTACGTGGFQDCNSSCALTECRALTESCNGCDDDRDTRVDEGFYCALGTSTSCHDTCGGTSARGTCAAGCGEPTGSACAPVRDDTYNRTQFFHECGFDFTPFNVQGVWCGDVDGDGCAAQYGPGPLVRYAAGNYVVTFTLRIDTGAGHVARIGVTGPGVSLVSHDTSDGLSLTDAGGGYFNFTIPTAGTTYSPKLRFSIGGGTCSNGPEFVVRYQTAPGCTGTNALMVVSNTRVQSL